MLLTDVTLAGAFLSAAREHANRPALIAGRDRLSYGMLSKRVADWAATLDSVSPESSDLVGVFAYRSAAAYAGILAALVSGRGYLPLNPNFPPERTSRIIALSDVRVLIVAAEAAPQLDSILAAALQPLTVLLPDHSSAAAWAVKHPRHRLYAAPDFTRSEHTPLGVEVDPASPAYLLFTSGSTGEPKGVPVSNANVMAYVAHICERYGINEEDRFSQMPDLTFDLSIQELWPCFTRGACLCVVPKKATFQPASFIREHAITMWTSVPSVISFMDRMHLLKRDSFPSVRWSVFCGEALTLQQVQSWSRAASNSHIENLYGPTEATVASTGYPWHREQSPGECNNGIVPIGWSFPHQYDRIADENGYEVAAGTTGELCLAGPQVTAGYLNDPVRTAERYVQLPDSDKTWYRTGDLAFRDANGCMHFAGRKDDQVKIRGYRVELQEIDAAVRKASGIDAVVSLAWPVRDGSADGVVSFVCGITGFSAAQIIERCRSVLPDYMVPSRLLFVQSFPVTANGKVDRRQLIQMLSREAGR